MKNILIHLTPNHKPTKEFESVIKIQIDNSFSLGWEKKDIWLFTNFEYEYNNIKASIVPDECFCEFPEQPRASKINTILYLFKNDYIKENEIYWFHDTDNFQLEVIDDIDIKDLGMTDYGWSSKWNSGSFFFNNKAEYIFRLIKQNVYNGIGDEESALMELTQNNVIDCQRLNITYNLGIKKIDYNYKIADKPLKAVHFHPSKKHHLDLFLYGKNELNKILLPERLIKIFKKYGY